jgi:hypothetical protein
VEKKATASDRGDVMAIIPTDKFAVQTRRRQAAQAAARDELPSQPRGTAFAPSTMINVTLRSSGAPGRHEIRTASTRIGPVQDGLEVAGSQV